MQMDFLDPSKKKAHKRRLMFGYFLMSIVIALGTLLIFYLAYGFDIDRKTGDLIQNGIVFVDSKPKNAKVFVNDIEQRNRTDTRLVLPAGVYTIRIEGENRRHWERTIDLNGGEIERLVYPYLLPNTLVTEDVATMDVLPSLATQSPDRRWLLLSDSKNVSKFSVYDTGDITKQPKTVEIPENILTEPKAVSSLKFVEWSRDNQNIVFERIYDTDKSEFIVFNHTDPASSFNINTTFGIKPKTVSLKNKRYDQIYYLDNTLGRLRVADVKNKTISAPLLEDVIDYTTYDDIVLFVTQKDVEAGRAEFRVFEGGNVYPLKNVAQSDVYSMDLSKYDGKWYYVVAASADNMGFVYQEPLSALKSDTKKPLTVTAIMRLDNPRFVSFSAGTQFIGLQSGNKLLTFDLEKDHQYRLDLAVPVPVEQEIKWMDGHRYIYSFEGQSYIVDFDGSNEETLVTSLLDSGPFFDRDYDNVFTFEGSKSQPDKKALTITVIDDR